MTIHAKNCESSCYSFRFMTFYSQMGDPHPPTDATEGGRVNLFIHIGKELWFDYSCKKM